MKRRLKRPVKTAQKLTRMKILANVAAILALMAPVAIAVALAIIRR